MEGTTYPSPRLALVLQKTRWNVAEHGLRGLARRASVTAWRKLFRDQEHLFFIAADALPDAGPPSAPGIRIECFHDGGDVPRRYFAGLRAGIRKKAMPESAVDGYLRRWLALFDDGARCWAAVEDERISSYIFTIGAAARYERHFPAFPLFAGDVLMFGAWTDPAFRGRGLYPALVLNAFAHLKREGALRFFARVKIWNAPSIRALRKIGMEAVAEYRFVTAFGRTFVLWSTAVRPG